MIFDLKNSEVQFKVDRADQIKLEGKKSKAIGELQETPSALDHANDLLKRSNLPVKVLLADGELKAQRGNAIFSIAKMSDGERSVLVLISEVITAKPSTVFVIDEPERHLHRSITVPMIAALVDARADCGFIFATHEIEAPKETRANSTILVRDCEWDGDKVKSWNLDALGDVSTIPEDVRVDLLGGRSQIVYVEGKEDKLDHPLYSVLLQSRSTQ